jgi:anti-anti-sigma regulatory factor
MVARRKVVKKKVTKASASQKSISTTAKSISSSAPKKKGVVAKRKPKATSNIILLDETVVISGVMELREKLAAAVTSHDEVVIDGSAVEKIDGTGLQLLVALMKQAVSSNTAISWSSASDLLLDSAAQLGLIEILGLDKLSGAE